MTSISPEERPEFLRRRPSPHLRRRAAPTLPTRLLVGRCPYAPNHRGHWRRRPQQVPRGGPVDNPQSAVKAMAVKTAWDEASPRDAECCGTPPPHPTPHSGQHCPNGAPPRGREAKHGSEGNKERDPTSPPPRTDTDTCTRWQQLLVTDAPAAEHWGASLRARGDAHRRSTAARPLHRAGVPAAHGACRRSRLPGRRDAGGQWVAWWSGAQDRRFSPQINACASLQVARSHPGLKALVGHRLCPSAPSSWVSVSFGCCCECHTAHHGQEPGT